ncbi:MAG: hypothetical protein KGJ78_04160 [Alphaproteobacteria bacterium]|nr:hypothetical protein [Alphaproteobacteria bacterium]
MLLRRVETTNPTPAPRSACSLSEAGLTTYQKALKERLPLAHIAEQSERPQFWFANNILQILGVQAKAPGGDDFVHLTRETTNGLKLADDMTTLAAPDEIQPRYTELRITSADLERYMEWARTVY